MAWCLAADWEILPFGMDLSRRKIGKVTMQPGYASCKFSAKTASEQNIFELCFCLRSQMLTFYADKRICLLW